jgi:hypothetical protein
VRINSDIVTWPKRGNNMRREKVPAAPNNRYVGLVLLFLGGERRAARDPARRRDAAHAGRRRQWARHQIPRPRNAKSVGILGSGWQAARS